MQHQEKLHAQEAEELENTLKTLRYEKEHDTKAKQEDYTIHQLELKNLRRRMESLNRQNESLGEAKKKLEKRLRSMEKELECCEASYKSTEAMTLEKITSLQNELDSLQELNREVTEQYRVIEKEKGSIRLENDTLRQNMLQLQGGLKNEETVPRQIEIRGKEEGEKKLAQRELFLDESLGRVSLEQAETGDQVQIFALERQLLKINLKLPVTTPTRSSSRTTSKEVTWVKYDRLRKDFKQLLQEKEALTSNYQKEREALATSVRNYDTTLETHAISKATWANQYSTLRLAMEKLRNEGFGFRARVNESFSQERKEHLNSRSEVRKCHAALRVVWNYFSANFRIDLREKTCRPVTRRASPLLQADHGVTSQIRNPSGRTKLSKRDPTSSEEVVRPSEKDPRVLRTKSETDRENSLPTRAQK